MGLGLFRSAKRKKKQGKTKEKRELKEHWDKMCKRYGVVPNARMDRSSPKPLSVEPLLKVLQFNSDRTVAQIPSIPYAPAPASKPTRIYTGKMAEREAKAQEEIERKKKRVAVPYNKGPTMYVEGYDPKEFGKK